MTISIRAASTPADYGDFERLIGEYLVWLRGRYRDDEGFVNDVLDRQSVGDEVRDLSTMYGPPHGKAFLAIDGHEPHGCGAYRRLDDTTCELKRVFVPERYQGSGIGRKLCNALIDAARDQGYAWMKLDSGRRLGGAAALYATLGFRPCPPYHRYPDALMPHFVFMALRLEPASDPVDGHHRGEQR